MNDRGREIVLFCLDSISNAGEDIIGTTTGFLIEDCGDEVCLRRKQLLPSWKTFSLPFKAVAIFAKVVFVLAGLFSSDVKYRLINLSYIIKYYHYYSSVIRKADKIVFSVGMFKYSTQNFSYIYKLILSVASKHHKEVMISAASVERPNHCDWRSRQLGRVLNEKSLKVFTTRDGKVGLDRLREYGAPTTLIMDSVGDPALWILEVYQPLKRGDINKMVDVVGINVIRPDIFVDYGGTTTPERLLDFYAQTIVELENRNINWILFCNGMECDRRAGQLLLEKLNLSKDKVVYTPDDTLNFIRFVAGCKCIIASRFHTCLTSYVLDVPFVGFIWDDKLRFFSEVTGCKECFLEESELNSSNVLRLLENACQHRCDDNIKQMLKDKTKVQIEQFVKS